MATRFYLPSSGTPPLASLAVDAGWETSLNLVRLPMFTTKQDTALTTTTMEWATTSTSDWCWWQFQSEALASDFSFLTSHYIQGIIGKCQEATAQTDSVITIGLRVVNGDGSSVRGTLRAVGAAVSAELWPGSTGGGAPSTRGFTGTAGTFSAVSALAGDRIILEVGLHGATPAIATVDMRIGDPSATEDFALTSGLTTDLDPWFETTATLSFGSPPAGQPYVKRLGGIRFAARNTGVW